MIIFCETIHINNVWFIEYSSKIKQNLKIVQNTNFHKTLTNQKKYYIWFLSADSEISLMELKISSSISFDISKENTIIHFLGPID